MLAAAVARWLVLIHQIPPRPAYLRVKVGRRLQALGAVAVKNSVYVLPRTEQAREDFQWVRREIVAGGGEASVCEASFVEGLRDDSVEALFQAARSADYEVLAREARALRAAASRSRAKPGAEEIATSLSRLRKRVGDVVAVDFFGARGRSAVEALLAAIESSLRPPVSDTSAGAWAAETVRGRTWVTRAGVHVDRIASAWLIRRFIDPSARFRFVRGEEPVEAGELRFDMFEADFTHEGDLCTFEVLRRRFRLSDDKALGRLGEIVHDVDLKDGKHGHPETVGVERLIAGIVLRHDEDEARLRDGGAAFDALYEYFKRIR